MKAIVVRIPDDASVSGWLLRALDRWSERPMASYVVAYTHPDLEDEVGTALSTWSAHGYGIIVNAAFMPRQVRVEVQ